MKSIGEIIPPAEVYAPCQSIIERYLVSAIAESRQFVYVREGDKPEGAGIFYKPQHKYNKYIADFWITYIGYGKGAKVWPPKYKLHFVIECDGKIYHEDKEKDLERDLFFKERGIQTIRFTGSEIYKNTKRCVDEILSTIYAEAWKCQ